MQVSVLASLKYRLNDRDVDPLPDYFKKLLYYDENLPSPRSFQETKNMRGMSDNEQAPPPLPIQEEGITRISGNIWLLTKVPPKPYERKSPSINTVDQQEQISDLSKNIHGYLAVLNARKIKGADRDMKDLLAKKEEMLGHCLSLLAGELTYKEFHRLEFSAKKLKNNFTTTHRLFSQKGTTEILVNKTAALALWLDNSIYCAKRKFTI